MVGVNWWDAVGCTQSAAEDGIGKAVLIVNSFGYFCLCSSLCQRMENMISYFIFVLLESICAIYCGVGSVTSIY